MAVYQETLARIARRMAAPQPTGAPWTPPAIDDLVRRLDSALHARRAA